MFLVGFELQQHGRTNWLRHCPVKARNAIYYENCERSPLIHIRSIEFPGNIFKIKESPFKKKKSARSGFSDSASTLPISSFSHFSGLYRTEYSILMK